MHIRTFYRQRRGGRKFSEAVAATGINKGVLSRIERGEQFPKGEDQVYALANFYDPRVFREVALPGDPVTVILLRLYPASILRCLQLERSCACGCGRLLPPDSLRSKRYVSGHRRHTRASS